MASWIPLTPEGEELQRRSRTPSDQATCETCGATGFGNHYWFCQVAIDADIRDEAAKLRAFDRDMVAEALEINAAYWAAAWDDPWCDEAKRFRLMADRVRDKSFNLLEKQK